MTKLIKLSQIAVHVPYYKQDQFKELLDFHSIPYNLDGVDGEYFQTQTAGSHAFVGMFIFGQVSLVHALVSEDTFITAWHLFKIDPVLAQTFVNSNITYYL